MPTIISQPVEAQSQILEADLVGEVNGIAVKGHGFAFYDAETNINTVASWTTKMSRNLATS